ncbi:MAG: ATP cone domain-containing protein, partial [Myxococcota bacterium]|nr:ATP cone domain-containing protein [Myxococcota bacterium]
MLPVMTPTSMQVRKRSGSFELEDVSKIVRAVGRNCSGLQNIDANRVAIKTIGGIYDGATTKELDQLSIQTAASFIAEEPEYSKLAARLLATYISKEVRQQDIQCFSQSISHGHELGLINDRLLEVVKEHRRKLNDTVANTR